MFCHYPASAAPPLCYNHGVAVVGGRSWGRRLCADSGRSHHYNRSPSIDTFLPIVSSTGSNLDLGTDLDHLVRWYREIDRAARRISVHD